MARAVMLIRSGGRVPKAVSIAKKLRGLSFVTDAYAVFGRFDVVCFLEAEDENKLYKLFSEAALDGVMTTESLVEVISDEKARDYGKGPFSS
ncbi:MAG TPA: Lrp/AsnC ligand binding domain-containing protein [Candidatus Acidoferrales bacterium]|nr:Lrp/AsnC ligand binding domain-containing protein [Candidatus Acidoferrales bacterium]